METGIQEAKTIEISAKGNSYSKYYANNFHVNGTPKRFQLEKYFLDFEKHMKDIIALSNYYYRKNGLIMRVLNIQRDFGANGWKLQYPTVHKKAKKVIDDLIRRIDIQTLLKDMIFELSIAGNLVCYDRNGEWVDIYSIGTQVEVSDLIKNGKSVIFFNTMSGYDLFTMDEVDLSKELGLAFPEEVLSGLNTRKLKVPLSLANSYFVKMNGSRYTKYGVPPLLPALDDLAHKNLMVEAERSTAISVINKILLFQIGNKDHPTTQGEVNQYSRELSTKDGAIEATVPWYVDAKYVEPSTEVFAASATVQKEVEDSLLSTLGISLSLVKGEGGGSYSENQVNLSGLTKTIASIRELLIPIFRDIFERELTRNNVPLENCPKLDFDEVLIDKETKNALIQWMFTTGGLSYQTMYTELGFDYDENKAIRKLENIEKVEDDFKLRAQPFQGNAGAGATKPASNKQNINGKPAGGRPEVVNKKSTNNDTPRPPKKT